MNNFLSVIEDTLYIVTVSCCVSQSVHILIELVFEASSIVEHRHNWWLVVHDPKPPVHFSCLLVITLSVNEISLCFDLITQRGTKLETKHR